MKKVKLVAYFFYWLVCAIYIVGVVVWTPVYNWKYAREHGFVSWLLLGEVVATGKSLAWPYFTYVDLSTSGISDSTGNKSEWNQVDIENLKHLFRARDFDVGATSVPVLNVSLGEFNQAEVKSYLQLKKSALVEANMLRTEVLDKMYPGLAAKYRDMFIRSLQLEVAGVEKNDVQSFLKGSALHDEWVDWSEGHQQDMYMPKARDVH